MRGKRGGFAIGYLLTIVALSASPVASASAIDRSDARVLELQRDLRSMRSRVERAPRAASFALESLQRSCMTFGSTSRLIRDCTRSKPSCAG
jgi:hypothetical protein